MQIADDVETRAAEWLRRYRAAGFRAQVDAVTVRPHPDSLAVDGCREMWSELREPGNAAVYAEVQGAMRRGVEAIAGRTDWPIKG